MVSLKQIEEFLASEPIAVAGVSKDPRKFGHAAFKELKQKGLKVVPVNPKEQEILGDKAYPDIRSLPPDVKGLIITTKKSNTVAIVKEAKEKGVRNIWIQQGSETPEAIKELEDTGINFISGQCILMYYKPHSVHKFHAALKKFFGRWPK